MEKKFWKQKKTKHKQKPNNEKTKVKLKAENVRNGLAQLVLTVIELIREIMEKQAIRRIEAGSLTEEQIEELGLTFQKLKIEVKKLREYFELSEDDLNLDLGPMGKLRETPISGETNIQLTLAQLLDRIFEKGITARGDIILSVADIELVAINLALLIASIDSTDKITQNPDKKQLKQKIQELNERIQKLQKQKKSLEKISQSVKQ